MSERRLVILARSDGYEGFERPSLDDARARELEAAQDVAGLRQLLLGLARDGVDGYDLVAVGGFPGTVWDFLGIDVADRDGRSAIAHGPAADGLNPHGLFSNQADAQAYLEAQGAAELVPVQRLRRSAIDPHNVLWFTIGNEFNPGDPFGRVVLTVDDADHVRLEHFSRQGYAAYAADLGPGVLEEIKAALVAGGFPDVPQHQIPAGAAIRQLEWVQDGEPQFASVYDTFGKQLDGYGDAFAILDSLTLQLTGYSEHDQRRTPVSNIHKTS